MVEKIALEALRRFPQVSTRTLAMYLTKRRPDVFRNYNAARAVVQRYRGLKKWNSEGTKHRHPMLPAPVIPPSRHQERLDYRLPHGVWGIMADLHIPFHERKPIDATLEWFRKIKVDGILFLGDLMDCEALGYWTPTRRTDFMAEVEATLDFLDYLKKAFPKAKIVIKQGNHEQRLKTYFQANAPQLIDMPTAEMGDILGCDRRGIKVLDDKQKITAGALHLLHGHEMRGGSTIVSPARWAFLKGLSCGVVAHWHKTSEVSPTTLDDTILTCWSIGCLCNLHPDYNPYGNQWNWGAAALYYGGKDWEFENRRILKNGKMV